MAHWRTDDRNQWMSHANPPEKDTNTDITHLTVVKESSLNHGTFITYTLGSLSADKQQSSLCFNMCTNVCVCITTQSYLYVLYTGLQYWSWKPGRPKDTVQTLATQQDQRYWVKQASDELMNATWWKCCSLMVWRSPEELTIASLTVKPGKPTVNKKECVFSSTRF